MLQPNLQLTKNFHVQEFFNSATADKEKIYNYPGSLAAPFVYSNICRLAVLLQRVRDHLGMPLRITSGYRCGPLNLAVGGVRDSRHLEGAAVDIVCSDMDKLQKVLNKYSDCWFFCDGLKSFKFFKIIKEPFWFHVQLEQAAVNCPLGDYVRQIYCK